MSVVLVIISCVLSCWEKQPECITQRDSLESTNRAEKNRPKKKKAGRVVGGGGERGEKDIRRNKENEVRTGLQIR